MTIAKLVFPHPRDAGARPTTTWPVGQLADYLLEIEFGSAPLLIREFADRYEAFVAGVQITQQAIKFVEENPAAAVSVAGVLLGALVGTAIGRNREGALMGAGIGLVAAVILNARLTQEAESSRP